MTELRASDPALAATLDHRAQSWIDEHGAAFPGDVSTGLLDESDEAAERFEQFANDAACPALDPASGRCDVYAFRPMTCRIFGPPVRMDSEEDGEGLGHCELCFAGATPAQVAACEMPVPHALEATLLANSGLTGQTVVAFALLRRDAPEIPL
jgi:Fe-S-cluster containining protein